MVMGRTGNIAGAAGAGADLIQRLVHGGQDLRVLSHSEIIVAAPDGHRPFDAVGIMIGKRIFAAFAHQIGEHTITAFLLQAGKTFLKPYTVRVCHESVSSVLKSALRSIVFNVIQCRPALTVDPLYSLMQNPGLAVISLNFCPKTTLALQSTAGSHRREITPFSGRKYRVRYSRNRT